jgi:hypothetical protein
LKRLNGAAEIRNALSQLPKTLDGTYERILCSIPPENQARAHKALQLLACSERAVTISALNRAVSIDFEHLTISKDEYFDDNSILEICTCLVSADPGDNKFRRIRLAHYTVKEFIFSERISSGPAAFFSSTEDSANFLDAQYYIVSVIENYYLAPHADFSDYYIFATQMYYGPLERVTSAANKAVIASKIWAVFDPLRLHFDGWIQVSTRYLNQFFLDKSEHRFPV